MDKILNDLYLQGRNAYLSHYKITNHFINDSISTTNNVPVCSHAERPKKKFVYYHTSIYYI